MPPTGRGARAIDPDAQGDLEHRGPRCGTTTSSGSTGGALLAQVER